MEQKKELNLSELRRTLEPKINPYRVVRRDEVEYVGHLDDGAAPSSPFERGGTSVYRVNGNDVLVDESTSRQLDEVIGIRPEQTSIVRKASGETGMRNYRNYMAAAGSIARPTVLALMADPKTCTVSGIVPIKEDVIPFDGFFDFMELFMEQNNMIPVKYEIDGASVKEITVYMDSLNPDVRNIAPDEDFLVNSYFMKWNLGRLELGRYFIRLICSNGQVRKIMQTESKVYSLYSDAVSGFLSLPRRSAILDTSFGQFSDKAVEAMKTRASMSELKLMASYLKKHEVDDQTIDRIAPFNDMSSRYSNAGFNMIGSALKEMKSGMNVWELYNNVTDFATNNTVWDPSDSRRGSLQSDALTFLMGKRDIHVYQDLFPETGKNN